LIITRHTKCKYKRKTAIEEALIWKTVKCGVPQEPLENCKMWCSSGTVGKLKCGVPQEPLENCKMWCSSGTIGKL